jgi:hypothetical protein
MLLNVCIGCAFSAVGIALVLTAIITDIVINRRRARVKHVEEARHADDGPPPSPVKPAKSAGGKSGGKGGQGIRGGDVAPGRRPAKSQQEEATGGWVAMR